VRERGVGMARHDGNGERRERRGRGAKGEGGFNEDCRKMQTPKSVLTGAVEAGEGLKGGVEGVGGLHLCNVLDRGLKMPIPVKVYSLAQKVLAAAQ